MSCIRFLRFRHKLDNKIISSIVERGTFPEFGVDRREIPRAQWPCAAKDFPSPSESPPSERALMGYHGHKWASSLISRPRGNFRVKSRTRAAYARGDAVIRCRYCSGIEAAPAERSPRTAKRCSKQSFAGWSTDCRAATWSPLPLGEGQGEGLQPLLLSM